MIAKHFQFRAFFKNGKKQSTTTYHTCTTEEDSNDQFYEQVELAYVACPSHDLKLVMGDANAKFDRETVHQPTIGKHSVYESTNENGLRLCRKQASGDQKYVLHAQTSPPSNLALPRCTHLQPDRSLLDRRKTLF
jgi:hypothetical protein